MKKIMITFLMLFLVVQYVSADNLLVSNNYAEDGYHCGKTVDVQNIIFVAENPSILIASIHLDNYSYFKAALAYKEYVIIKTEVAAVNDSNLDRKRPYWHRVRDVKDFKNYKGKSFYKGMTRLARDGFNQNRVI